MRDIKRVSGGSGCKALVYFEVVSTLALVVGLRGRPPRAAGPRLQRRARPTWTPRSPPATSSRPPTARAWSAYLLHLIPDTFFDAFAKGDLLQVLVIAVLTGFACTAWARSARRRPARWTDLAQGVLRASSTWWSAGPARARSGPWASPSASTGSAALVQLAPLVATFYVTSILFVLVVLGAIAAAVRLLDPASSWPISARSC